MTPLKVGLGVRIAGEGEVVFILRQRVPGGWMVSPVCCPDWHVQFEAERSIQPCG